jgi:NADPH:quinone reductase-like Zn-dependent oxidoreductase
LPGKDFVSTTFKAYEFMHGQGIGNLRRVTRPVRAPGPGEIRVAVRAVSLNYRDLMAVNGIYPQKVEGSLIPASDCAGEVIAVGEGVTDFRPGDRVANTFFHSWDDGPITLPKVIESFGGNVDGVLTEELVLPRHRFARLPDGMDFEAGSTLTCAGVTAWNAMFVSTALPAKARVLVLGTGGVSIWALQLGAAAGFDVYVTSSSDEKLERARALGARGVVNYRRTPEWQDEILRMTGGQGVDLVLEVGGQSTLSRSVAATGMGGTVALIGGVSGFGPDPGFAPILLMMGAKRMVGIYVGSRAMLQDLSRFTGEHRIAPVVDRVFDFDDAAAAYRHLESGQHFGKVVIRVGR